MARFSLIFSQRIKELQSLIEANFYRLQLYNVKGLQNLLLFKSSKTSKTTQKWKFLGFGLASDMNKVTINMIGN